MVTLIILDYYQSFKIEQLLKYHYKYRQKSSKSSKSSKNAIKIKVNRLISLKCNYSN